ncbi:hypothetical protein BCR39DRAFT_513675 [Naematelia encephala]|uniref:RING-type domain-containing protein n=1 Tax=Naematelia encephala TaxID=71784 RepID=A0A1Y2BJ59_9TREE|nr:hypothetical protein BCR39DRAFT_513675 [Naematelia encephala]
MRSTTVSLFSLALGLMAYAAVPSQPILSDGFELGGAILYGIADPPRLPMTSRGEGQGWLARWLSMGGEGNVIVQIGNSNLSMPHRPAAFPSHLYPPTSLPLSGFLTPFISLPPPRDSTTRVYDHSLACLPPAFPPIRYTPPSPPYTIALIERGGCDFATKVRAAQERGAAGVIVGDMKAREGETREEGLRRGGLITMFHPDDTDSIFIPSVFVSRASYLELLGLFANHTDSGRTEGKGLWVELGEGADEGGALSSLLSFALLMPSLFLLATIAVHRVRVARQREKDRAPPLVVLSLPERIWTPDIVWEKDDSSDSESIKSTKAGPTVSIPPPPPISPSDVRTPPAVSISDPFVTSSSTAATPSVVAATRKPRKKSQTKYFSKDECAICMDSFNRGDVVRILPCGHVFHKDECDEWLLKWRKLCPTCRADVTLPPGASVQGSKLTPVAAHDETEDDDEVEEEQSWSSRFRHTLADWRSRVFGRRVRLEGDEEEAGERTPLVNRSRAGSEANNQNQNQDQNQNQTRRNEGTV